MIKNEEDLSRVTLIHVQQGRAAPRPHPVYAAVNERIGTVVRDYPNRGILDYLRSIAHNIAI